MMQDIWDYLEKADKPILMYGMGNGADKILRALDARGVVVSDFFASDGFVRGHLFHGKRVLSYSQAKEKYGSFIVLLSFATCLDDVIVNIIRIAGEQELYIPDVPVAGGELFTRSFYLENKEKFEIARSLLSDELSRYVFDKVVEYKLSGRIEPLLESECEREEVFSSVLSPKKYKTACDLGAYNGDTAKELISYSPDIERIYALEPDRRNYRKLCEYAKGEDRVIPYNAAAWSSDTSLCFSEEGNRNSGVKENGVKTVDALCLDRLVREKVDYIKMDVEGSEREALIGAKEIIRRDKPQMLVSAYHRSKDIFSLILQIHELNPEYKFYLRRFRYFPAWDLNLYCI